MAHESEWGCVVAAEVSTFLPGERPQVKGHTYPRQSWGSGPDPSARGSGSLSVKWGPPPTLPFTGLHEGGASVRRGRWPCVGPGAGSPRATEWPTPAASTGGGRACPWGSGQAWATEAPPPHAPG